MKKITTSNLKKLPHRLQVTFALFCANQVKHLWEDVPEAVKAVEITRRWLKGKATKEECKEVARAAYAVVTDAAYAVYAANAAAYAAHADADVSAIIRKEQLAYYDDLLSMVDGRVDKILVGYKI